MSNYTQIREAIREDDAMPEHIKQGLMTMLDFGDTYDYLEDEYGADIAAIMIDEMQLDAGDDAH